MILWVNKVGPSRNPQENYLYYSLPWCVAPDKEAVVKTETSREGLGEALMGYELRKSGIDMKFQRVFLSSSSSFFLFLSFLNTSFSLFLSHPFIFFFYIGNTNVKQRIWIQPQFAVPLLIKMMLANLNMLSRMDIGSKCTLVFTFIFSKTVFHINWLNRRLAHLWSCWRQCWWQILCLYPQKIPRYI